MLDLLGRKPFPGNVTPEITESMIEINTQRAHRPCRPAGPAARDPRHAGARPATRSTSAFAAAAPTRSSNGRSSKIFSKPRFSEVSALYGYLAKQFTVFGQHVHIGCSSGDEALFLLHSLNRYMPHFIALSASSPFVQGHDTPVQFGAPEFGVRVSR